MAEAVFREILRTKNSSDEWFVDSAAICDFHVGREPDKRTLTVLKKHGITDYKHEARQVSGVDFSKFDYIFGMDESNISELESMREMAGDGSGKCKIQLLGAYDPLGNEIVHDPYYESSGKAFDEVYDHCMRCCENFLSRFGQTNSAD